MPGPLVAASRVARLWGLLLALTLAVPALAGCLPGSTPDVAPSPEATVVGDLARVQVTGDRGAEPKVTLPGPFMASRTQLRMLDPGPGAAVKQGQRVTIDYVGVNGADGTVFDSSWGKKPTSFVLDPTNTTNIKGLVTGLVGVPVGSRALLAIPPQDAYGVEGLPSANIGPTDTLLVVVDVTAAVDVLSRATGKPVQPKQGQPTVKLDDRGRPTITLPSSGVVPSGLVVQPLIQGTGKKVEKGQKIMVRYTGVVWPGGRVFDSNWDAPSPSFFPVGTGRLLAGWDEGIVGQPVGSQVLLVVPPDKGYGATGDAEHGIKGTDTLVFVVDILDAA